MWHRQRKSKKMDRVNNYTVIDLEMTGLHPKSDKVIEIGAIKVKNGKIIDTYAMMVNPMMVIPQRITELTGITNEEVSRGEDMDVAMAGLLRFIDGEELVGQNITFDYSFIKQWAINKRIPLEVKAYDTLKLARQLLPVEQPKNLEALCEYFGINRENAHRALDDAEETRQIFEKLMDWAIEKNDEKLLEPRLLQYKAKRQTPATAHQKERLREYREAHNITDPINWETLTRNEASRMYDNYRKNE